ncbi:hypothetical protein [Neisseria zalophi]|uniref:Uncharacterized protein n=1 Tax=Neisseria zalophi TaxID=640030 RepID=A0A5J6PUR6_9NEIS|nr:hypothetical protein [Neisseria zalophi]QEY26295.1 hypothetical protein D0T92_06975 [Neisseria zalophi]
MIHSRIFFQTTHNMPPQRVKTSLPPASIGEKAYWRLLYSKLRFKQGKSVQTVNIRRGGLYIRPLQPYYIVYPYKKTWSQPDKRADI